MRRIIGFGLLLTGLASGGLGYYIHRGTQAAMKAMMEESARIGYPTQRDDAAAGPNAADIYAEAAAKLPPLEDEESIRLGKRIKEPWSDADGKLGALLDAAQEPLELARQAARLRHCDFIPKDVKLIPFRTPPPGLKGPMTLVRLLLLHSRRAEAQGRVEEALSDCIAVLGVARQIHEQKTSLLHYSMVLRLILELAYEPIASLIAGGALVDSGYVSLRDALLPIQGAGRGFSRALGQELQTSRGIYSTTIRYGLWFLPDGYRGQRIAEFEKADGELAQVLISAAEKNRPLLYEEKLSEVKGRHPLPAGKRPGGNLMACLRLAVRKPGTFGECFAVHPTVKAPEFAMLVGPMYVGVAKAGVLLAASAIRLYELQRRTPPASLAELVPAAVSIQPQDPFDGFGPLRYRVTGAGWSVYSVGPDGFDESLTSEYAGGEEPDWRKPSKGDIGFSASQLRLRPAPKRTGRRTRGR